MLPARGVGFQHMNFRGSQTSDHSKCTGVFLLKRLEGMVRVSGVPYKLVCGWPGGLGAPRSRKKGGWVMKGLLRRDFLGRQEILECSQVSGVEARFTQQCETQQS